jgi:hypothetical protein
MAKRSRNSWSRLHFLIRFLGLSGLLCLGGGVALAFLQGAPSWESLSDWTTLRPLLQGQSADLATCMTTWFLLGGAAAAALALAIEILGALGAVAGRRSALGFNASLQMVLAIALLAGVNWYSYSHFRRADWTSHHLFTLPADVQKQLGQLQAETNIIVYQRHKTFGLLGDKPDAYDYAAERKVVEKVKDLVEQFREFGPQFHVFVLDIEEEGFNDKLKMLTAQNKELREAIDSAQENSIFFAAGNKVQRLSFNDFYELDKTASRAADFGRGNLVLLYQGVEPFARKVLNIDQKRPKVGVLVIHEVLTTQGPEDLGLSGFKKTLNAHGIDVEDVILKKFSEMAPPEAAVTTYDENRFDQLEEQLAEAEAEIKNLTENRQQLAEVIKYWTAASLDDLTKKYASQLNGRKIDESVRSRQLAYFKQNEALMKFVLDQALEERNAIAKEKSGLNVDVEAESRRISDLKAKLERSVADCDLLYIPRMTLRNVALGDLIPNRIYRLDEAQVAAIREFIKQGKPVFACLGPANQSPQEAMQAAQAGQMPQGPDDLERLFEQLGIRLGKQTVLFNVEGKSFADRRSGILAVPPVVEIPPVEFEGSKVQLPGLQTAKDAKEMQANPIGNSMLIAAHSLGRSYLDLRIRNPRPIYYQPNKSESLVMDPTFLITNAASWNEDQPFPSRDHALRFEPPKPDDPTKGTLDEKRLGPFPIGVAVEAEEPRDWYAEKETRPEHVRVAVIGSGGVFTGDELAPAKAELLLNTCNWLLGRDDLLPRADQIWSYPRVQLEPKTYTVWRWGAWLGLPVLFAYLGLVVLMLRRLR